MTDTYSAPDQSYFDWLKQKLFGVNTPLQPTGFQQGLAVNEQPDFTIGQPFETPYGGRPENPALNRSQQQLLQDLGILPKGLKRYPTTEKTSTVTGNADTTGFVAPTDQSVGEQVRNLLGMQPLDKNNPAQYVVNNNDPFGAPPDFTKVVSRPDYYGSGADTRAVPLSKNNVPPALQTQVMTRPETPLSENNRIENMQSQIMSRPNVPEILNPNYVSPVNGRPEAAPQFQSMVAGRPDVLTPFQSMIAGRPETAPQFQSMVAGRPETSLGQNNISSIVPTVAEGGPPAQQPVTNASAGMAGAPAPQGVASAAPSQNGAGGFLSNLFGGGGDPQAINPNTGLTNAQTRLMMFNNMANLGFKLAAAGEQLTPAQRAQIMSSVGEGMTTPQAISAMQSQLLQQQKMSRENAQQANLAKIMQSPDFQKQFKDMSPQYQALAQAAAASGDISGVMGLIEKSQPQFANGMIINRQAGIATDTISNQSYDLNTGKPIAAPTSAAATGNTAPQDYSQYGVPQNVRVNPQYFDGLSDEYKQRLAKVASGADTLSGASRGNAGMMQRMQMDVYRAFPDYNPIEAQNRASIIKSFAKSDNLKSLYGQSTTLGTFAQHEVGVLDKAEKLGNGPLPAFDAVRNEFLNASGDPRIGAFNTELHMLQGEVGKMVRAGVLTDQEQSALNANVSSAKSPEQIRAVLDAYHELVNGRISAVDSATQRVMGDFYDPKKHSLITPETQKMFDKFNSNSWGRPQAKGAGNVPSTAADYLKKNPNLSKQFDEKYGAGASASILGQ